MSYNKYIPFGDVDDSITSIAQLDPMEYGFVIYLNNRGYNFIFLPYHIGGEESNKQIICCTNMTPEQHSSERLIYDQKQEHLKRSGFCPKIKETTNNQEDTFLDAAYTFIVKKSKEFSSIVVGDAFGNPESRAELDGLENDIDFILDNIVLSSALILSRKLKIYLASCEEDIEKYFITKITSQIGDNFSNTLFHRK